MGVGGQRGGKGEKKRARRGEREGERGDSERQVSGEGQRRGVGKTNLSLDLPSMPQARPHASQIRESSPAHNSNR
eukprot:3415359-Rhodomonas_salina.3